MPSLDVLAAILVVLGGLNWGLIGVFDFNLVQSLFGSGVVTRVLYILVGVAALYQIGSIRGIQRRWGRR